MFGLFEKAILGMAFLRLMSGSLEILAAVFILKYNEVEKALLINSSLALIGPLVLIATTTIGLFGIAEKVSFMKMFWILCGVGFILYGVKSQ
ncbi:YqhV family protein [Bacillus sp. 31A1R]|uniref:YqhV family protein n=1 Tax=Robertmurraya mangrovi TaxID=3098077 RepID=A0ABU5ITL8_9BACI|nr:YqhV family protein [Bacillus sp. 31A1R]MDZ5470473.1 YqhV family protein [Bacillus sp. 31A1R]